jgi:hypothetical protein
MRIYGHYIVLSHGDEPRNQLLSYILAYIEGKKDFALSWNYTTKTKAGTWIRIWDVKHRTIIKWRRIFWGGVVAGKWRFRIPYTDPVTVPTCIACESVFHRTMIMIQESEPVRLKNKEEKEYNNVHAESKGPCRLSIIFALSFLLFFFL